LFGKIIRTNISKLVWATAREKLTPVKQKKEQFHGAGKVGRQESGVNKDAKILLRQLNILNVMPDLIRYPSQFWIPAFAGMTAFTYIVA